MSNETALIVSIAGSVLTSGILWWWLNTALGEMLKQLCDRPGSTDFWSRYTLLMLVIAPLTIAVFFSPDITCYTTNALQRILFTILLGQFIAFALVGHSLFKAVNRKLEHSALRPHQAAAA